MSVTLTDEQASQLAALLRDLEAQPLLRPVLRIRSAIAALTREPAPAVIDALNEPMIGDRNAVATHRVAAPSASACQCRAALEAVLNGWYLGDSVTAQIGTVEAALAKPCAPADAGEWSEAGLVTHKFKAHYDVAGSCTEPLSNIAQDGDYIRIYEPRYRRRAPEREGGDPDVR